MFKRLDFSRKLFSFLSAIGIAAVLGACGGGDDPGNSYPNISYTGVDTEAVINESNAADFPFVMLEGSSGSDDVANSLPFASNLDTEVADGIPDQKNINRAADLVRNLINKKLNSGSLVSGVTQEDPGICGGRAITTATDTGTQLLGTIEFNNYCEFDFDSGFEVTAYGRMSIAIDYYLDTDGTTYVITGITMTIEYLKLTVDDGNTRVSEEFSGTISMTGLDPYSTDPVSFEVSVNFKYQGQIFKVTNLNMVDDISGAASISARLYHPIHGFVEVTTTDPFEYYAPTDQFCGGSLQIVGSDGAVPPATPGTVTIDFTADATCSTYNICIQVNSDPQNCANFVPWGTEPWPTAAIPAPTSPTPAP